MTMLHHLPYSPDLAPCDFFIFPKLKNALRGVRSVNIQQLQQNVHQSVRMIPQLDFESSLYALPERWMKCITAGGGYFEGRHYQVDPGNFGIEFVQDSDEEDSDPE